jgi:antirestriction protein
VEQSYSYYDADMYDFINLYGEDNFMNYYEQYVQLGENHSYDAVDAFIDEFSLDDLNYFEDAYSGEWESFDDFAEQYFTDVYGYLVPEEIESYIDYEAFANDLAFDYVTNNNYVFNRNF